MEQTNPYLIYIGAILTFVTLTLIEAIKSVFIRRERRRNFILLASQQLNSIKKNFDKLKSGLDNKNYYDYIILDLLSSEAKNLGDYRSDAIYLKSGIAREQFIDLTSDILTFLSEARSIQDYFYKEDERIRNNDAVAGTKEDLVKYFDSQKIQKTISLIEINRRIQELVKTLK